MIIVGELINASRKRIKDAIVARDGEYIAGIASDQVKAGAAYIDVNAGVFYADEADHLSWLIQVVQSATGAPCCIDSPNSKSIETALKVHKGLPMINSISLEADRWQSLLPVVAGTDFKVVALCMADAGMPETAGQRLRIAEQLVDGLCQAGIAQENIFVDPLVQPIATNSAFGAEFLKTLDGITVRWPDVHKICGLSNISYGLPERKMLNQTFMAMAIDRGLDVAIVNPLDNRMMANIVAAEALAGQDEYCMRFLKSYREKRFAL